MIFLLIIIVIILLALVLFIDEGKINKGKDYVKNFKRRSSYMKSQSKDDTKDSFISSLVEITKDDNDSKFSELDKQLATVIINKTKELTFNDIIFNNSMTFMPEKKLTYKNCIFNNIDHTFDNNELIFENCKFNNCDFENNVAVNSYIFNNCVLNNTDFNDVRNFITTNTVMNGSQIGLK